MLKTSITLPSIYPKSLSQALANIRETTFGECEIIVVSPFEVTGPDVIWVPEKERRGCAYAHARAAERATGDFLLAFADDHRLMEGWDATAARDLAASEKKWGSDIGAIGLRFVNSNLIGTVFGKYYPNFPFMRREVVRRIGWIGEDYQQGFGDCDLGMRIWDAGGWCEHSTRALILIHPDDSRKSGANYSQADLSLFVSRWGDKYGVGWETTHLRGFNRDIPLEEKEASRSDMTSESRRQPRLIFSYKEYNIFDHFDAFLAIAQRVGEVDINQGAESLEALYGTDNVFVSRSIEGLADKINELVERQLRSNTKSFKWKWAKARRLIAIPWRNRLERRAKSPEELAKPEPRTSEFLQMHRFARTNNPSIKVSIIYNYYKKETTIFNSLASIAAQISKRCSPKEIEIIIVDDGSEGEDVSARLPEHVLYVWQRKFGYGISRAKNVGAALANGRFFVFLDADIMVSSSYLDAMLEAFERFGDNIVQCGYIWDYFFKGCPDPRTEFGVWHNPERPTRRFVQIAGGNMAISREMFQLTSGFDEDLIYGGVEDLLFGYQYGKLPGAAVYFNRSMESWHIPHPPSLAHAQVGKSWDIVREKYPDFYESYIVKGLR